jgi:hypothetical protein
MQTTAMRYIARSIFLPARRFGTALVERTLEPSFLTASMASAHIKFP